MKRKIILLSIAFIIQIIKLFKNKTKLAAKQTLLKIAQQLDVLSPTDLIKNFDKLEDYSICMGKAFSSQQVTSVFKPKISVIISKLYQISNFNLRGESSQFKKLIFTKRPAFFTLNDQLSSIPILQTLKLPTITTHFHKQTNENTKISFFKNFINLINYFKDMKLPYFNETSFQENYLPEGTLVAIFGKYKKESNGQISCEKPLVMGLSRLRIIQKLLLKVRQLKYEKFLLIFGITFCFGFGLRLFYSHFLQQAKNKENLIDKLQDTIFVKSRVCFNCQQKLSDFYFQKCGHLSLCKQCKDKIKICGECKAKNIKGIQLYAC